MAERTLICLDLDGTLVESHLMDYPNPGGEPKLGPRQDRPYTEPVLLEGRVEVLKPLAESGQHSFAIVTNQGGVAWGYCNESEARLRVARALALLDFFWHARFSVHISFAHRRATIPGYDRDGGRRKPNGTMILEAMSAHLRDPEPEQRCIMVGDRSDDEKAAQDAFVQFQHADDFFERLG